MASANAASGPNEGNVPTERPDIGEYPHSRQY